VSQEDNEQPTESPPGEVSQSLLAQTERMFLRLTLWQTVLSVAGVIIAVVAMYAALTESAAVRAQTAAAVWPFVQLSIENSDTGEMAHFAIAFTNTGVGPARMRSMQALIDGEPVVDWVGAIERLDGELTDRVGRDFISNRVLSPQEKVEAFSTSDPGLARKFMAVSASPGTSLTYCYCSIFDDCWLADSTRKMYDPEPVEACPDFGSAAFRN
jgi:hypothetical protein